MYVQISRFSACVTSRMFQEHLIQMLTPNEIIAARRMFEAMDVNQDGYVSEYEAKECYRNFYVTLHAIKKERDRERCPLFPITSTN